METKNKFNKAFKPFSCEGDMITTEIDGWTITARIERDNDTRPDDFDCFDPEQIEAWKNDEWFYCGVVLAVEKNGVTLSKHAASLWGVECNYPGSKNEYLTEVSNELLDEAIEQGKQELNYMIHKLTLDKSLRPDFDYDCDCGYYVCDCCGYPTYPIEIYTDIEGKDICPNCEQGNMLEIKKRLNYVCTYL